MKITKSDLKRIIAEEIKRVLEGSRDTAGYNPYEGMWADEKPQPSRVGTQPIRRGASTAPKPPGASTAPKPTGVFGTQPIRRGASSEKPPGDPRNKFRPEALLAVALTNINAALDAIKSSKAS